MQMICMVHSEGFGHRHGHGHGRGEAGEGEGQRRSGWRELCKGEEDMGSCCLVGCTTCHCTDGPTTCGGEMGIREGSDAVASNRSGGVFNGILCMNSYIF